MQLQQHEAELDALGVVVAVVTFQTGPVTENYVQESGLKWPLLIDESLRLYSAYGMQTGSWWDVMGPASWWGYIKLLLRGRRLHRPTGDVQQLGGDVLIDPQGIVRLHHVQDSPTDRPPVARLLETVRQGCGAETG